MEFITATGLANPMLNAIQGEKIVLVRDFQLKKYPKISCGVGILARLQFERARMPIPLLWRIKFLEVPKLSNTWGRFSIRFTVPNFPMPWEAK